MSMTNPLTIPNERRADKRAIEFARPGLLIIIAALLLGGDPPGSGAAPPAPTVTASAMDAPDARPNMSLSAEDIRQAEAQYSPQLREYRRQYRLGRLIRDPQALRERMAMIGQRIEAVVADQGAGERAAWLELQQQAYAAAEQFEQAAVAVDRRYELLGERFNNQQMMQRLLDEAGMASARREYAMATVLYDKAEGRVDSQESLFGLIQGRARMVSERDGTDGAVSYLLAVAGAYADSSPELAGRVHFLAAEERHRAGRLDLAMNVLEDVQRRYAGTAGAARARQAGNDWAISEEEARMMPPGTVAVPPPARDGE